MGKTPTTETHTLLPKSEEWKNSYEPEDQGVCDIITPCNVRRYPIKSHQHEQNKNNINRHAKKDRGKPKRTQPYIKHDRQLRNAECRKTSLPQERVHQQIIQYQMANPKNMHISNNIQTEKGLPVFIGILCTYIYVNNNN